MAKFQSRDILGCLLLVLVITEAARKWVAVSEIRTPQTRQIESSHDSTVHQVSRRLLIPAKPGSQIPALCQVQEPECEEGVAVKCTQGSVLGCSCEYMRLCYPRVSKCIRYNSTHTESCGF